MGQLRPASADAGRGPRRQRLARSLEEVWAVLGLRAPRPNAAPSPSICRTMRARCWDRFETAWVGSGPPGRVVHWRRDRDAAPLGPPASRNRESLRRFPHLRRARGAPEHRRRHSKHYQNTPVSLATHAVETMVESAPLGLPHPRPRRVDGAHGG